MNKYLKIAKDAVDLHGSIVDYIKSSTSTYDPATGLNSTSESTVSVKMYKKHLKLNQYNYPNLIGKEACLFYLVNDSLSFTPTLNEAIIADSIEYSIKDIQEHRAEGTLVLYRIVAVRG
jgi:hypothetical protein